jgi:transcriptional/translational regulatory protein YebC/TACO1
VTADGKDPDDVMMQAIDAGAEDVQVGGETIDVYTEPGELETVKRALEERGVAVSSAESTRVPKTTVQLNERDALQTLRLVEKLEALDDVQKVYFNAEFSDAVLASYSS